MTRIVVLGSTGSIGTQTLDVVREHPDRLAVVGLGAGSNTDALRAQLAEFPGALGAVYRGGEAAGIPTGMSALVDLATMPEADVVVVSVAGVIGLEPTIAAIRAGKTIALASKEVLVAAGEYIMPLVREHGVAMLPIDSEHSAIFQCLQGYRSDQVAELILTASGGPFRGRSRTDLAEVTVEQALDHPTWKMGGKITIDSATLMNKALETIEARWLFDVPIEKVSVVVHPQSIVHSFVRLADGSVLAQLGWPNMRLPIQYALLYPERVANAFRPWSPLDTPSLTFEAVDEDAFPGLRLAREAVRAGGTMPCAMNAANEEAVASFLRGEIGFLEITDLVGETMSVHEPVPVDLASLLDTDHWARRALRERIAPRPA